ncbi:MAG TPA: T9SS type A sorting domain-containing protein [Chitinophagales bacterium]|nr:T9SS type A sorting domain-containing protein [Chitinophagales bacterium]
MKKQLLSIALCGFSLFSNAQPTITNANAPAIGDILTSQASSSNVNAGSGGANVVWDFSSLVPSGAALSATIVDPSATPYGGNYPAANMASGSNGTYGYYQVTATEFNVVGIQSPLLEYPFSDYQKEFVYPYTYNTTFTDHVHGEWVLNTVPTTRDGFVTFLADGYGTLKLPTGTIQNVIRVKYVQNYDDVFTILTNTYTNEYDFTTYSWYVAGNKNALLSISYDTTSLMGFPQIIKSVSYYPGFVGVNELQPAIASYSLFPQPAAESATLEFSLDEPGSIAFSILTVTGQLVKQWNNEMLLQGNHTEVIDIADLAQGIYFVRLDMMDKKPVMVKLMKQ